LQRRSRRRIGWREIQRCFQLDLKLCKIFAVATRSVSAPSCVVATPRIVSAPLPRYLLPVPDEFFIDHGNIALIQYNYELIIMSQSRDEDEDEIILDAAECCDWYAVEELLKEGANVNAKASCISMRNEVTLMHYCAQRCSDAEFLLLLVQEYGAKNVPIVDD
jgi:hypothetical protein